MSLTSVKSAKRNVGTAAAKLVQDGMIIGLGSGSTSARFIEALVERCREGLSITAVATSATTAHQAEQGGISLIKIEDVDHIDLAIDGADEIDTQKRMIKGGGGALLREKIVASTANEMIVIVDESKLVDRLGTFGLPIEIVPFGYPHTLHKLHRLGFEGHLRTQKSHGPYVSDNGNYIYDLAFAQPLSNPEETHAQLLAIPGVVETGLFIGIAGRVMVGYEDGRVEIEAH